MTDGADNEHRAADAQARERNHCADEPAAAEGPAGQALDRWTEVWAPTLYSKEIPGPRWEQLVLGTPGRCQLPHSIIADSETRIGHCLRQSRAGARLCLSNRRRSLSRRQLGRSGEHLLAEWGQGRRQPQWQPWQGQFWGLGEERERGELTSFHGPHSRLRAPVVTSAHPQDHWGCLCSAALRQPRSSEAAPGQPCHGQGKVAPQGPGSAGRLDQRSAGSAASSNAPCLTGGVPTPREGRGSSELAQQPRGRARPLTWTTRPGFAPRP